MACYHPVRAYYSPEVNPSGKRSLVFNSKDSVDGWDGGFLINCGYCIGCRLDRSRKWAVRCVHEAQMHKENCFITLTYSDAKLPEFGSLRIKDFQDFMKRFRKNTGSQIRYFHCGEYGDKFQRPHYHACIFGYDFPDKVPFSKTDSGFTTYTSSTLETLWPFGFHYIGDVTFESAAYVARYITKKYFGKNSKMEYEVLDYETGEIFDMQPEYCTMSRRPGIGKPWFDKFQRDVFPDDFIVINGKKINVPSYYDKLLESSGGDIDYVKYLRSLSVNDSDNTRERLRDKEICKEAKFKQLKRSYENDES